MAYEGIRARRPLSMGRRGAVASNHPVATAAGMDILRAGGNAADAAVAIAVTLGVVEPHMSGLGGDGFYHAWNAKTGASNTYNGTGAAPAAATIPHYRAAGGIPNDIRLPQAGGLAGQLVLPCLDCLGTAERARGASRTGTSCCRRALVARCDSRRVSLSRLEDSDVPRVLCANR